MNTITATSLFETEWIEFWEWHEAWTKGQARRVDDEGRLEDDPIENPQPPDFSDVCQHWLQNKSFHQIEQDPPTADTSEHFSPHSTRDRRKETYSLDAFNQVLELFRRETWQSNDIQRTRRKKQRVASILCNAAESIADAAIELSLVPRLSISFPSSRPPPITTNADNIVPSVSKPHLAVDSGNGNSSKTRESNFVEYFHYLSRFAPPKEAYMALMSALTVCDGSMLSTRAILRVCEPLGYCLAAITTKRAAFVASSLSALVNKIFELRTGQETVRTCLTALSNTSAAAATCLDESSLESLYGAAQWSILVSEAISNLLQTISNASREAQQEDDIHGVGTSSCLSFAELSLLRFIPFVEIGEFSVPNNDENRNSADTFWVFSEESHSKEVLKLSPLSVFSTGTWLTLWKTINDDNNAGEKYSCELAVPFKVFPVDPAEVSNAMWSNCRDITHVYFDLLSYEAMHHLELRNNVQDALCGSDGQLEAPRVASALTTYLLYLYTMYYHHTWTTSTTNSPGSEGTSYHPPIAPPLVPMITSPLRLGTLYLKAFMVFMKNSAEPSAAQGLLGMRYMSFGQQLFTGAVRYLSICKKQTPERLCTLHSLHGIDPVEVVLEAITSTARTESTVMRAAVLDATRVFAASFTWVVEWELWSRAIKSSEFTGAAAAIAGILKNRWWTFAKRAVQLNVVYDIDLEATRLIKILEMTLPFNVNIGDNVDLLVVGLNLVILILGSEYEPYKAVLGDKDVTRVKFPLRKTLDELARRVDIETQLEKRNTKDRVTDLEDQMLLSNTCPLEARLNLLQFVLSDARALFSSKQQ